MKESVPERQAYIDELRARQRNIVFPETVRNSRPVDVLMWRGNPQAPLVQRIGIGLFALAALAASFTTIASAFEKQPGDIWFQVAVGLFFLFISIRLGMNTFRRK